MAIIDTQTVIRPGEIYPLEVFKKLAGFGAHAMRQARRNGLRVRRVNGRAFVHADDFARYLEVHGGDTSGDQAAPCA